MRIKIEIGDIDPVLLKGQIAVLCELAEWLGCMVDDDRLSTDERLSAGVGKDAVDGIIESLGERVEIRG